MDLRSQRGAISAAEGCMFGAVAFFSILLVALLVMAYFRFQERPSSDEMPERLPVTSQLPAAGPTPEAGSWQLAAGSR